MAISADKIAELRKNRNIPTSTSASNKKVSSVDISKMRREREERQAKSQASREVMREMIAPSNMSFPEQNIRRNVQTNQMKQFNESPIRFNRLMDEPDFQEISKKGAGVENKPGKDYLFGLIKGKPEINNPVEYVNQNLPELVMGTSITGKSDYDLRLSKLTQDERNIYNYLLGKKGRDSADAYIKELDSELNRRYQSSFSDAISEVSDENKVIGAITNVGSSMFTPAAYLETVRQKASDILTGREEKIDPYSSSFSPVHMESATREGLKEDTGAFGDFLIDTGLSMAQFLSKIPLGQNLALGIMASGAAGSTATDVLQRGGTTDQALMTGAVAGLAEGITEKIGMERLFKFKDMPLNGVKTILRETVKGMGAEGSEELITEVVNILADKIIMQDKSDYDAMKRQFMQSGLSESEATGKTILELAKQVGISFAGGALSGGIMGAGAFGLNVGSTSIQGSNINNVNDYISQGLSMDHTSEAYQLAQQIKTDIVNEVKPSSYQIGNLSRLVNNAMVQDATQSAVATMDEQFQNATPVQRQAEATQENILMNIAREMTQPTPQTEAEINVPSNSQKAQATIETVQTKDNLPKIDTALEIENRKPTDKTTNVEATWRDIEGSKVKGIEKVDNGNITVNVEVDGKTVVDNIDNVTFDNPSVEQIYNSAKVYQTNGAKAFVSNYNGNIDIPVYQRAFNNYYDAGLVNLPMDKINSAYGAFLSESVRMNAYNAGMNDAKAETQTTTQKQTTEETTEKKEKKIQKKKTVKKVDGIIPTEASKKLDANTRDGLNALAKATGINIRVEESIAGGQANGMYKNGTLHIALDSDNPYMVVAKHELTHAIQQASPELYKQYKDFVINEINKSDPKTFNKMVNSLINAHEKVGMEITRSQAMDEIVADASEMFLTDMQAIQELAKENRSLAEKILDFITDLVNKIQATLTDMNPKSKAAIELNGDLDVAKQAEKLWIEALAETSSINTEMNTDSKFSLKDSNGREISKEQQEYFKDSKILDENGDLLVVYHGTNNDFFTFDTQIGREGSGAIWFSKNQDYAEEISYVKKGNKILEAYINIENPLTVLLKPNEFADNTKEKPYVDKAKAEGYDGVIFKNDTDNEVLQDEFYAVFNSDQAKLTTNINPTNDPDIRYQLKNVDYEEYNRVVTENEQLNKTVDLIRKQFDLTKDIVPNQDKLTKIAKDILKKTNSTYDLDTLIYNLDALWKYTKSTETPDINQLMDASYSMAKMILKTSKYLDDGMYKQYANLRDKLRNTGITISEVDRGDLADVGGYHQFHKDNFGRIKLVNEGTSVDTLYSELIEEYPEFFTDDITHPAERLKRIADVAADLQPSYINDYGMDMNEASWDIAKEMYDAYFNVPEATLPEQIKTELKKTNDEYKANIKNAREESKAEYEIRLAEIKAMKNQLIKDIRAKYEQANAEDRLKYKEQIDRLRQYKNDRLLAQQTKYRKKAKEKSQKLKSNAEARQHRVNIEKNVKTLSDWLIKPKDNKHVPEFLRKTVADFIQTIDFTKVKSDGEETQKSLKWKETMARLKQEMKKIDNPANWDQEMNVLKDTYLDIDPNFVDRLESFIDNTQVRVLSELDLDQLAELDYLVKVVRKAVTSANQMMANERYKYVTEIGEATIRETKALQEKKQKDGTARKIDKFLSLDQMDSFTFGDEIGEAGASVIQSLRDGFDKFVLNTKEAIDYIDKVKANHKDIDIKKLRNDVHTFNVKGGEVKLTTSQIMELYMLSKREQALGHITGGGIKVENKTIRKGLKKEVIYNYKSTVLSETDLADILSTLTQEQRTMAEELRGFFDVAARWGNEVTMKLYDDMKFTEENYYPIKTDENTNKTNDPEASRGLYALKNIGVTKATVKGANNPIIIGDIFDTFSNHVSEMANYNAFVVPLSDTMKWYNFKIKNVDDHDGTIKFDTVKQGIERVLGKDGKQYFTNLIKDINGVHKQSYSTEIIETLLRNVKIAAVGLNPSVVLQQPAAYLRAGSVMDYKYVIKGLTKKPQIEMAKKYSPIALWKSWGYFDINIGRSLQTLVTGEVSLAENIREKSLWAAGMMDDITWGILWNAVEFEISDTNPNLTYGSEEFNQAVGKRLSYIVDRTQVVDTVLHRSQMMRSKDTGVKSTASFMSEPNKSYNLARTAILNAIKNKNPKTVHNAFKVVSGVVLSNALAAALKSLYTALGDDEEEDYATSYWNKFSEEFVDNLNPLNLVPLLNDIQSMADGYAPQEMHLSGLYTLILNLKAWGKYIAGDSKKTIPELLRQFVDGASKTFGIPASGLLKAITKAYHGSIDALESMGLLEPVSEYEKLKVKYDINDLSNSTASSKYYDLLYNAKESGDTTLYNQIYKDLIRSGRKPSSIESAIKSRQKKKLYNTKEDEEYTHPLIKELVDAQTNKNYNAYKSARDKLIKEGFSMTEVESAMNSYKRDQAKANAPTVYEWIEAYKTGNRSIWQPIFRKMRDAGWTQKDLIELVK